MNRELELEDVRRQQAALQEENLRLRHDAAKINRRLRAIDFEALMLSRRIIELESGRDDDIEF